MRKAKSIILLALSTNFLYANYTSNIFVYENRVLKKEAINLEYERTVGLEYLNLLRQNSGMTTFLLNELLNKSSQNHANYLQANNQVGHYEGENYQYFTGVSPKDRVDFVGYDGYEGENVAYGVENVKASIDNLFSAIYHRFGFLNYDANEIGIGISGLNYVYNIGNGDINSICKGSSYSGFGQYYYGICIDYNFKISSTIYENAKNSLRSQNPSVVLFPYNNMSDFDPVFYEESPDPLPNHSVSGNPISIKFNEYFVKVAELLSFELYKNSQKVENVLIMTNKTDPNKNFTELEFALFPLERLEWGTNYEVKSSFNVDGEVKNFNWSFKTKSLDIPIYTISTTNESIDIKSNQDYAFYLKPLHENDVSNGYSYQYNSGINIETNDYIDQNTIKVKISGNVGQKVIFTFTNGRKIEATISNTDSATYPTISESFDVALSKGWNLISIPVNKTYSLSTFGGDTVFSYKDEYTKNPATIKPKEGFWVLSSGAKTYTFEGEKYQQDSFATFQAGWHLLGAGEDIDVANATSCQNCIVKSSWTYNAKTSSWNKNPNKIYRGEGFWIYK